MENNYEDQPLEDPSDSLKVEIEPEIAKSCRAIQGSIEADDLTEERLIEILRVTHANVKWTTFITAIRVMSSIAELYDESPKAARAIAKLDQFLSFCKNQISDIPDTQ